MKVVILADNVELGLSHKIYSKDMTKVKNKPAIWYVLKHYAYYGFTDFIIAMNFTNEEMKTYFCNTLFNEGDISIDYSSKKIQSSNLDTKNWKITLVDTKGYATAYQIEQAMKYTQNEPFMLNYGNVISDISVVDLLEYHFKNGKLVTLTAVKHKSDNKYLDIASDNRVTDFHGFATEIELWKSLGFMVLQPEIQEYIKEDSKYLSFEDIVLPMLAKDRQLQAYKSEKDYFKIDSKENNIDLLLNDASCYGI